MKLRNLYIAQLVLLAIIVVLSFFDDNVSKHVFYIIVAWDAVNITSLLYDTLKKSEDSDEQR